MEWAFGIRFWCFKIDLSSLPSLRSKCGFISIFHSLLFAPLLLLFYDRDKWMEIFFLKWLQRSKGNSLSISKKTDCYDLSFGFRTRNILIGYENHTVREVAFSVRSWFLEIASVILAASTREIFRAIICATTNPQKIQDPNRETGDGLKFKFGSPQFLTTEQFLFACLDRTWIRDIFLRSEFLFQFNETLDFLSQRKRWRQKRSFKFRSPNKNQNQVKIHFPFLTKWPLARYLSSRLSA